MPNFLVQMCEQSYKFSKSAHHTRTHWNWSPKSGNKIRKLRCASESGAWAELRRLITMPFTQEKLTSPYELQTSKWQILENDHRGLGLQELMTASKCVGSGINKMALHTQRLAVNWKPSITWTNFNQKAQTNKCNQHKTIEWKIYNPPNNWKFKGDMHLPPPPPKIRTGQKNHKKHKNVAQYSQKKNSQRNEKLSPSSKHEWPGAWRHQAHSEHVRGTGKTSRKTMKN